MADSYQHKAGFTLMETMMAVAVSAILMTGMFGLAGQFRQSSHSQVVIGDLHQNLRAAIDMVGRDLRMAGYGVLVTDDELPLWTPNKMMTNVIQVTEGINPTDSDTLDILLAQGKPVGTVTTQSLEGDTSLMLSPGASVQLNRRPNTLVFIGKLEMARVMGVSGDRVFLSTDPRRSDGGLRNSYPEGTSIEHIKTITYSCKYLNQFDPPLYALLRKDSAASSQGDVETITSVCVEGIDIQQVGDHVAFALTGRSTRPEQGYIDPTHKDNYRRTTLTSGARIRNERPQ